MSLIFAITFDGKVLSDETQTQRRPRQQRISWNRCRKSENIGKKDNGAVFCSRHLRLKKFTSFPNITVTPDNRIRFVPHFLYLSFSFILFYSSQFSTLLWCVTYKD